MPGLTENDLRFARAAGYKIPWDRAKGMEQGRQMTDCMDCKLCKEYRPCNDEVVCDYVGCNVKYATRYGDCVAYKPKDEKGDKEHALHELAQCVAVILRMMEVVDAEA